MKKLKEVLVLFEKYLTDKGLCNPRYDAQVLLASYFKCSRLDLFLQFDRPIIEKEQKDIRVLLQKRAKKEPLQYITGVADFYGYEFFVNKNVLIPRIDSETLVSEVLTYLKKGDNTTFNKVLDIGSGSGCLPIAIALELQKENKKIPNFIGMDYSKEAIEVACKNALKFNITSFVDFFQRDIFNNMEVKKKFDLIISNPPYIAKTEIASLDQEVRNFEPLLALTDNKDGLSFYYRILEILPQIIEENGALFLEIGYAQGEVVSKIFKAKFKEVTIVKDMASRDRVVSCKGYLI